MQSLRRKPCGRKPQNRFKKSLKIKKNRPAGYAAKLSTPDFYGIMEQPPHSSAGLGDAATPVLSGELIL